MVLFNSLNEKLEDAVSDNLNILLCSAWRCLDSFLFNNIKLVKSKSVKLNYYELKELIYLVVRQDELTFALVSRKLT